MESFATPYPLFYSEGDQEVDKGQIGIHSVLQFKRFQAQLSRVIGIPANQLSAVFVCRRTTAESKRQKLPINENTNFNIILNQHNPSKEKDCYFLVSLKKSKKERKGSRRRNAEAESVDDDDSTSSRGDASPASQRPGKDDGFAPFEASSPNSVLELEQAQAKREEEEPQTKPVDAGDNPVSNPVSSPVTPVPRQVSPPVTRIGGELLRGGGGEQAKFGVIGSGKSPLELNQSDGVAVAAPAMSSQARFKDPVQKRPVMPSRPSPGLQEGISMRLLSGNRAVNNLSPNPSPSPGNFHQHVQEIQHFHFHHHQQQQQQRLGLSAGFHQQLQQRFQQARSSTTGMAGGDGYGRGSEQFCPDCASYQERNIRPPPFHCCINDRITTGFNGPSPAGPIERPVKRQVKAAA